MRRFATTLAVAASTLMIALAAPATAAPVAYRLDLKAGYGSDMWASYNVNLTAALVADVADVFGTSASAVTLKDCIALSDDSGTFSAVFTVDGGSDTTFLASAREAPATWTTATNALLQYVATTMVNRDAAAAAGSFQGDWTIVYIFDVARLDAAPTSRVLEVTLHGLHLATASTDDWWATVLVLDLAGAFGFVSSEIGTLLASTRIAVTDSTSSGVGNSVLTVRFTVKPMLDTVVNTTTFFASNGTVAWLSRCMDLHIAAAYADLGVPVPASRRAAAMTDMTAETALTVTGTSVAPGDEAYTNAPGPVTTSAPGSVTNAPGGAAAGVTTAAFTAAAVAVVGASLALF